MKGGGEWQLFNLKELFGSATRGKRLKSADRIEGDLPFVTAGENNTGISAFIGNDVDVFSKNTITIDMFGSAKYRNYEYGADDHIAVIHTQDLPKNAVVFITSAIHKVSNAGQFSYSRNFYAKDADELNILLPSKNGVPDYNYMENYMRELQKERLRELQLYLKVTNLSNYELTDDEINVVGGGDITWSEYRIDDVFNINTPKRKFDANKITFGGNYPYVARGDKNNGIRGYITEDIKYLNGSNTISFGQDTATMFYQENAYFTGDKIKVFSLKNGTLNKLNGQFLISTMKKSFSLFSWGSSSFSEENLKQSKIQLPTKNNQIDFEYMVTFIKAIQKLIIKDLVLYTERELKAYEQAIDN